MPAKKVAIKLRVTLPDGSRPYLSPVISANRKIKPLVAMLKGEAVQFPSGVYYLRYQKTFEPVGSDAQVALEAKKKRERILAAQADGISVVDDTPTQSNLRPLTEAVAEYLAETKIHKSKKTYAAYSLTLSLFSESCTREHLEKIDRKDVLGFMAFLKEKGNAPRTVSNRIDYLKIFLNHFGVSPQLQKSDRPRYTEKAVSAYTKDEICRLLSAADLEESETIQFFLFTGTREQETEFGSWPDLDFTNKTFSVVEKLDLGFTPKDKEEGKIPIPDSLVDLLRERRRRHPKTRLIFTNTEGNPQGHFLRILKRVALRAGLNCGHCYNKKGLCCASHPVCDRIQLHRLRKTFATMHHEAGVPARTIQRWLRHSDLSTTLRYLAASDDTSAETRQRVNSTFAAITGSPGPIVTDRIPGSPLSVVEMPVRS